MSPFFLFFFVVLFQVVAVGGFGFEYAVIIAPCFVFDWLVGFLATCRSYSSGILVPMALSNVSVMPRHLNGQRINFGWHGRK